MNTDPDFKAAADESHHTDADEFENFKEKFSFRANCVEPRRKKSFENFHSNVTSSLFKKKLGRHLDDLKRENVCSCERERE